MPCRANRMAVACTKKSNDRWASDDSWPKMDSAEYLAQNLLIVLSLVPASFMWLIDAKGPAVLVVVVWTILMIGGQPWRVFGYK